jgi:tripartite-type tricarboxylate transporter receptor subunit TctC
MCNAMQFQSMPNTLIFNHLSTECNAVQCHATRNNQIGPQFIPLGKGSPEELDRFVKSETVRWAKVLQQAGVAGSE